MSTEIYYFSGTGNSLVTARNIAEKMNGKLISIPSVMEQDSLKTKHLPFNELIPLADRSFQCNEKCNGCGICTRGCPVNNIKMVENRPFWQHHCENCLPVMYGARKRPSTVK
jgi:ferredoxin